MEKLIVGLTFPRQDLNLGLEPSILTVLPDGDNVRYYIDIPAGLEESDVQVWACSVYITGVQEFTEFAKQHPTEKIVVGGYEPTINPGDFTDLAGRVIVGPADSFWETLSQEGQVVKGITRHNRIPRYDLWDISLNQQIIPGKRPGDRVTSINTSQGCPFRCDFCCSPLMSDHLMSKPLWLVEEECKALARQRPEYIFIRDENFPLQKDWKEKLVTIERMVGAKIYMFASANLLTDQAVEFMAEHGVYMCCLGLEDIMKEYRKNRELDLVCERLHKAGIYVYLSFIVDPVTLHHREAERNFYQRLTQRFNELHPEMVCGNFLMPFKGTPLWDQYKEVVSPAEDFPQYDSKSAFLEKDPGRRAEMEYNMFKVQWDYYRGGEYPREFHTGDTLENRFNELYEKRFRKYEEVGNH